MKILVLTLWYPHEGAPGLGAFVMHQTAALAAAGCELRVVHPLPRTPPPLRWMKRRYRDWSRLPAAEERDGIPVDHPRYVALPRHWMHGRVGDWLAEGIAPHLESLHAQWPFEVIHAHGSYPCAYAAIRFRDERCPAVKVVATAHRTCIVDSPRWSLRARDRVAEALRRSDHVIFVSEEGRTRGEQIAGTDLGERATVVANGVDPTRFAGGRADDPVAARLRADHRGTFNVLFVGYLGERKGVPELLDALVDLERARPGRFRLFLVGRDELDPDMRRRVTKLTHEGRVIAVGEVPPSEIASWMRFADAFVLPSRSEGVPTVLFESLAIGLPGVFTRVGGTEEIVRDGREALLIEPGSPRAIATALLQLERDPEFARGLALRGRELVTRRYTWERNATSVSALFAAQLGTPLLARAAAGARG